MVRRNALSEQPEPEVKCCPYCRDGRFVKHGRRSGVQRYRCVHCKRTFTAFTGGPLWRVRYKALRRKFDADVCRQAATLRGSAEELGVSVSTIFRWRHENLERFETAQRACAAEPGSIITVDAHAVPTSAAVWHNEWVALSKARFHGRHAVRNRAVVDRKGVHPCFNEESPVLLFAVWASHGSDIGPKQCRVWLADAGVTPETISRWLTPKRPCRTVAYEAPVRRPKPFTGYLNARNRTGQPRRASAAGEFGAPRQSALGATSPGKLVEAPQRKSIASSQGVPDTRLTIKWRLCRLFARDFTERTVREWVRALRKWMTRFFGVRLHYVNRYIAWWLHLIRQGKLRVPKWELSPSVGVLE